MSTKIKAFDDQAKKIKPSAELDAVIFEMIPKSPITRIEMSILDKRESQYIYLKKLTCFGRSRWSKEDGYHFVPEIKGVIVHKDNKFTKYKTEKEAKDVAIYIRAMMKDYVDRMVKLVRDNLKRYNEQLGYTAKATKKETERSYKNVMLLSPKLASEIEEQAVQLNMTERAKMELTVKRYLKHHNIKFPASVKKEDREEE